MTALRLWKLLSAPSSPNYVSMFLIPVKYKLWLSFSRNFGVIFSSLCNFLRGSTSICCVCFSLWGIGSKIQVQWSELTACPTIQLLSIDFFLFYIREASLEVWPWRWSILSRFPIYCISQHIQKTLILNNQDFSKMWTELKQSKAW